MLDMLLKQMLPPGFDLEKTISQVQTAIATTVATVQRIEAKQDTILARLDAAQAVQDATLPVTYPESNHDDQQPAEHPGNDYAGDRPAIGDGRGNASDA